VPDYQKSVQNRLELSLRNIGEANSWSAGIKVSEICGWPARGNRSPFSITNPYSISSAALLATVTYRRPMKRTTSFQEIPVRWRNWFKTRRRLNSAPVSGLERRKFMKTGQLV
jgi:hypothetical protein